jgi:hypothetical protein
MDNVHDQLAMFTTEHTESTEGSEISAEVTCRTDIIKLRCLLRRKSFQSYFLCDLCALCGEILFTLHLKNLHGLGRRPVFLKVK